MDAQYDGTNPRSLDVNLRAAAQMREYVAIADRIAAGRPARVLDWGCGWGQMTELLARRGLDVAAFDYRTDIEADGERPLERYPGRTAYFSRDPRRLPYADGAFDAALSCGVLEHVQDPGASLDELRRVLRRGGTLYVYKLPNRHSYLERIARALGLYYHGALPDDRVYTPASARAILERHGFRVDEVRLANLLPLTLTGAAWQRLAGVVWAANRAAARLPGLRTFATNVEAIARVP